MYSKMDQVKFFKSCLPESLLGPFLNTLSHMPLKLNLVFQTFVTLLLFYLTSQQHSKSTLKKSEQYVKSVQS